LHWSLNDPFLLIYIIAFDRFEKFRLFPDSTDYENSFVEEDHGMAATGNVEVGPDLCLLVFDVYHSCVSHYFFLLYINSPSKYQLSILQAAERKTLKEDQRRDIHLLPYLIPDIIFHQMLLENVVENRVAILIVKLYKANLIVNHSRKSFAC